MGEVIGIRSFYEGLYADGDAINERSQLVIWSPADKVSRWSSCVEDAVVLSEAQATASDLYYGVCLQDRAGALEERARRTGKAEPSMEFSRGYATTASVIPAMWLDLDIAGGGHEKKGLPRNQADADRILADLPLDPSWIVGTGGGLHVYWVLKEPLTLANELERDAAAAAIHGWQTLAIDAAANLGFNMDSTHDLSRVLRPVGSVNHKYGSAVHIRREGDARYHLDDFTPFSTAGVHVRPPARVNVEGMIDEDREPPPEKLLAMLNLVPRFGATWRRERKEFPSQSEYDLSLATMAAATGGWRDEEIVALVMTHRKAAGEPTRADRPGYWSGLLGKAKRELRQGEARERITDALDAVEDSAGKADEDERGGFLRDLSALLGFEIRRIIRYDADPPTYRLVLESGSIHLGDVEKILNPVKFRAAIAAVSGALIGRFTKARWDPVAQAILRAVETVSLGADSTAAGLVGEWLGDYLAQYRPSEERQEAIEVRAPFVGSNRMPAFFLSEFRAWLAFARDERLGRKEIATLLRTAGCAPKVVAYERGGRRTTCHVWVAATELPVKPRVSGSLRAD